MGAGVLARLVFPFILKVNNLFVFKSERLDIKQYCVLSLLKLSYETFLIFKIANTQPGMYICIIGTLSFFQE